MTDILELRYVELSKAKKEEIHLLRTPFHKWVHVLKYGEIYEMGREPLPAVLAEEDGIEMAIDKMREARSDFEVRQMIEDREQAIRDQQWRIDNWLDEAREKGREEGRAQAAREIAIQMREAGADPRLIEKTTGVRFESAE